MRVQLERLDRGDVPQGDPEEHHAFFDRGAIIPDRQAFHRLLDLQERQDHPHGDVAHGRGLLETDQHHHAHLVDLHPLLAQPCRAHPIKKPPHPQQPDLQPPRDPTPLIKIPQDRPPGGYLL